MVKELRVNELSISSRLLVGSLRAAGKTTLGVHLVRKNLNTQLNTWLGLVLFFQLFCHSV